MSTNSPIITKAVVELTFANGVTRRLILDDKDATVALSLDVTNDIREATADDASFRTFDPGPRQRVDVHLTGRGPLQLDIPDPREAIDELRRQLAIAHEVIDARGNGHALRLADELDRAKACLRTTGDALERAEAKLRERVPTPETVEATQ